MTVLLGSHRGCSPVSIPRTRTPRICVPRNSRTLLPASSDGPGDEDEDAEEVDQAARPGRGGRNRACIPQNQFAEMKFYSPPCGPGGASASPNIRGSWYTSGARPHGYAPARTNASATWITPTSLKLSSK